MTGAYWVGPLAWSLIAGLALLVSAYFLAVLVERVAFGRTPRETVSIILRGLGLR